MLREVRQQQATRREAVTLGLVSIPFFSSLFRPRSAKLAGIRFSIKRKGRSPRRYLWVHGDEVTARETLLGHMEKARGTAFLVDSDTRHVSLAGGRVDPNRLWSRAGAERNLRRLNETWTDPQIRAALDRLDEDREEFLSKLLPRDNNLLVALHNNSRGYSIKDEVPISDAVSLKDETRPHEFMLCTDPADYAALSAGSYNVVLQRTAPAATEDDGSLSRLAAQRNVRYVNIEAALGELAMQRAMLAWVETALPS